MKRFLTPLLAAIAVVGCFTSAWGQVLNDSLQGSTIGTRENGAFVAGGWQVTNQYDTIYWHVPTLSHGSFEYNVSGLASASCPGGALFKNELSHMYDWTFGNADIVYSPGYRDNPYKHFIRKQCEVGRMDTLEIVWAVAGGGFFEVDSGALAWNSGTTYLWKTEWENTGGNAVLKIWRDGGLVFQGSIPGSWNPAGHSVRIAASPRRADEGASVGAVYSNVKVFDLNNFIPSAPTISVPANGETVKTQVSYVQWTGDSHTMYQVRCNTVNDPNTGIAWDSQQVGSDRNFTWTGALSTGTYYVFARLASASGWGPWSANGRTFTVDTFFNPPGTDYVKVQGNSYANFGGAFVGLGFTHMRGMQRCKYDRPRYESDCAFMASKKFKYQRILTMVSWCGLEIAPLSFTGPCGGFVPAWSDYWQQFRDCIDLGYSNGLMTEITVFAGAQDCMPNKTNRFQHLDSILANMPGREHKVCLIEVANENYANGVSDADVKEFGQYLADRTVIPVALTSPGDISDAGIVAMYAGSAADISTVHFTRDIGTNEGGWLPVRDTYRTGVGGIPPMSSNEPIGAGSSVATENDPIKLCMAGCFAWNANLISYVYHSRAGVFGWELCCPIGGQEKPFNTSPGVDSYQNIVPLLPKELSSWVRNDGKASDSPFTSYSMGQANKWWTEVGGSTNGCIRNISAIKAGRFVTTPIGILGGGLELEARRPMAFKVYNPLTGSVDYNLTKNPGDHFTLATGPGAYVIIGDYTDVPIDPGEGASLPGTLTIKPAGAITINGNSSDWALGDFVTKTRAGEGTTGDIALVGFDGGSTVYRGAYVQVLPTNAADHTVKIYSRQDATYQYFLARVDDNQIQTQNPVGSNWLNDCVEFYIDPGNDGGSAPMSNSTSDIQLVIDAANQKNVYMTTSGYATQVLAGVTSAVTTDGTGWWLEVRITKTALDPDLPSVGIFGLDFCFRDNDNNNDPALTTIYTWSEGSPVGFPSKIPGHWGDAAIQQTPFGGSARAIPGIIQAEDFDIGGQGVAYNDAEATNFGGAYRTSEGVDITTTVDTGGGYIVGWINAGEWMEYTVNVNQTGDYAIKVRLASASGGGSFHISLDGVTITPTKNCADTGGWDTWTTITVPGIFMSAGNNKILRFTSDTNSGFNINHMDFAFGGADVVSVDLGNPDGQDGMTHIVCCDGNTIPWTVGGHNARVNNDVPDHYYYFEVTDIYAFQGNKNNATITFDYYDKDTGTLTLQYDGTGNAYTVGPSVALTNSLTWKTAVWQIGDAYFGNRENGGADFRIFYSGLDFYIDTVMVFSSVGTPPPGAASNPSPANGATSVAITGTTLSWTAGSGATNRDVRFGTANPPPFVINQTATTYSPGTLAANTTYFWRIDEKNTGGTTTGTVWSFTTLPLPGAASAPNPANAATLVPITSSVSWTAGSNASSHDVRFGTANPPPFVINQAGTSYTPPTMTANTTYFWRIDEKNSSGTTTGTVWSFTTLPLPGVASAPNPANAATGVSITVDPTWTAGSNASSHDVRFGTANPPPFVVNQAGTTYDPGTLLAGTTYFWRIDEKNSSGTTTGTVWSFTTLPLPGLASAPSPANAATGVSITATVSWTAGSNTTSHDVRFGTANPPPFIVNQAGTTYNPGTLAAGTTYFWRIDEKNGSGTTTGTVWSFTTLALPGLATAPNPANAATGVAINATLSWTAGSNVTSHDVRFGTANPPPFIVNQAGTTYNPGTLLNNTTYFWRIDEKNGSGTTTGTVWSFTTIPLGPPTLLVKNIASALTIDGNSSDWNVASYVTKIRGGEFGNGDIALVGFDGGSTIYRGAFAGVLPTAATDHTAKVYSRHDSTYLYFLIRNDDNQIQTQQGVAMNWANDCVEFYIDPTNNGGSTTMSNSTSDIQLVIDAANQKNVYMCTSGYTTQVLAGVTSAVTTDGTGWWCEVRIQKSVLDLDIPANGTIGLDFNFRDNDNNNDAALTTIYTWAETSTAGFPSKIPDHWGKASLPVLSAPGLATNPNPANAATGVATAGVTLSWTAGLDATSHDVRFGTANPPPLIQNQAGTTYNTGAMTAGTTYFWRIDEKNGTGTTTGTVWSFTTAGAVTFSNSAFPSNADGWNIVVWRSGQYVDGTMAWSSTNGNPTGNMLSNGSGATNSADMCTREGGEINKLISTAGRTTLQVQYDYRMETNQTGTACSGSGCSPLEGDCADKIAVYYSTAGTAGPWTLLEAVNASSVTQNVWATRTLNLPVGANNQANFALRFRWQFNTASDGGRLDNVKVIDLP